MSLPHMRIFALAVFCGVITCSAVRQDGMQDSDATAAPRKRRGAAMLQIPNASTLGKLQGVEANANGFVIPLQRVRSMSDQSDRPSFYIGNITVGYPPQRFSMMFDTTSGNIILPHTKCKSDACVKHRQYSSWRSTSSEDILRNGTRMSKSKRLIPGVHKRESAMLKYTQADLGQGQFVGIEVRDRVCLMNALQNKVCTPLGILAGLQMDEVPFKAMPNDGIFGLALSNLSCSSSFNFLEGLLASRPLLKPQFGMSFGRFSGELHIGGSTPALLPAPIQWFPVHDPDEGYWQVPIQTVRVGGVVVDTCPKGCHAIMDTGTSRLGVQKSHLPRVQSELASALRAQEGSGCLGPDLAFDLGGMELVLGPADYTNGQNCEPFLGSLDLEEPEFYGAYTFGEMVLRHYFVVFDWKEKKMGFAPVDGVALERTRSKFADDMEKTFV